MKIFFDGGCRPNPGPMETAVVARGQSHIRRDLGHGSNHEAEWLALLHAIELARWLGEKDIILIGDSANVVRQANGQMKCRGPVEAHLARFHDHAAHFRRVRVRQIGRAQNLAGIALAALRL